MIQAYKHFAERLGVSDRYVRKLFSDNLGVSPKQFALYQQCLFAKKLLQETQLPVGDVAFAAGFNSVRRFNDAIKQQLSLTPRELRKQAYECWFRHIVATELSSAV